MKKVLFLIVAVLLVSSSAIAVPSLQLYIDDPDAWYDYGTDTWMTSSSDFDLWVIASGLDKTNNGTIHHISLVAALGHGIDPSSGSLFITPEGGSAIEYTGGDFTMGTPPIPAHGIYPTYYHDLWVADRTPEDESLWEEVQDWIPGGDGGSNLYGYVYKFGVSTTFDAVHFDAYGFYDRNKTVFAPFSHDAEYAIPEPTSMALFGIGLLGGMVYRRFRKS